MIRLFTTTYDELNESRKKEYKQCLDLNINCELIDEIYVLSEGGRDIIPVDRRVVVVPVSARPTYADYFNMIIKLSNQNDLSIIANTDIFFNNQLKLLKYWALPKNTVLALSRWDVCGEDQPNLYDRNDSQDVWVFRGPLKKIQGDFPVGVPRCDNRILYELKKAGYEVINPSFSVRAYHLHSGIRQEYSGKDLEHFVAPPYTYLWPHNLWSLPRTIIYNLRHPDARLSWRFDKRKFARLLPVRAVKKIWHVMNRRDAEAQRRNEID